MLDTCFIHPFSLINILTDILASRIQVIVVIQIRHGREEALSTSLTIADNQATFTGTLDFIHFNDRTSTLQDVTHDILIDLESEISGLLQKVLIGNLSDIGLLFGSGIGVDELALGHKVATQLGSHGGTSSGIGAERLNTIGLRRA